MVEPTQSQGQPKNGRHVTWPSLMTILGGVCAFLLSIVMTISGNLREQLKQEVDNQQQYIIHNEAELRRDLRQLREQLGLPPQATTIISPHETTGLGQNGRAILPSATNVTGNISKDTTRKEQ